MVNNKAGGKYSFPQKSFLALHATRDIQQGRAGEDKPVRA